MTTRPTPHSAHPSDAAVSVRPADIVLNLIVIFLAPIFLSATDGDITLARLAAIETVKSYRANSHADLLEVAQIIAFGFATLGSLCLSMADDISLTMVLRLRGNANALSRSAEVHRRRLEHSADTSPPSTHQPVQAEDAWTQPPAVTPVAPPLQPPPTAEAAVTPPPVAAPSMSPTEEAQALWAAAIAEASEQLAAELPHLSPVERRMAAIQAAALSDCASGLLSEASAQPPRPGQDDPEAQDDPKLYARSGSWTPSA